MYHLSGSEQLHYITLRCAQKRLGRAVCFQRLVVLEEIGYNAVILDLDFAMADCTQLD